MFKKFGLATLFALSTIVAASAASAGPREDCMLFAGCFFDSASLQWVCPDPNVYMLCDV